MTHFSMNRIITQQFLDELVTTMEKKLSIKIIFLPHILTHTLSKEPVTSFPVKFGINYADEPIFLIKIINTIVGTYDKDLHRWSIVNMNPEYYDTYDFRGIREDSLESNKIQSFSP